MLEDLAGNDLASFSFSSTENNSPVSNSTVDLLVVNKTTLTIDEGGTGTFTVKLAQLPDDDVVVAIHGKPGMSDYAYVYDSVNTYMNDNVLDFTTVNWNTEQTVTMNGRYDLDDKDNTGTIRLTATASGSEWGKVGILGKAKIDLTVTDTQSRNSAIDYTGITDNR